MLFINSWHNVATRCYSQEPRQDRADLASRSK